LFTFPMLTDGAAIVWCWLCCVRRVLEDGRKLPCGLTRRDTGYGGVRARSL
jgi:hypothetical protein